MSIVAIDPSLICTAVVIDDKKFVYTGRHVAYTSTGRLKRWFDEVKDLITLRIFDFSLNDTDSYTTCELLKLDRYTAVCNTIVSDIVANVRNIPDVTVGIEGYSYSSITGPLIDLVTFGTLLRSSLRAAGIMDILIIPPQELKMNAGSLVYPQINGKAKAKSKSRFINARGVSAGAFTKHDMLQCLYDMDSASRDKWIMRINKYRDELLAMHAVPKPLEDINDAKLLYEWLVRARHHKY